jgi:hypothetical protein
VTANAQRTASYEHRFEATIRLAEDVSRSEVVFFVGSGFSIDSEGNSADRLVGRLLAGILALDTVLAEEAQGQPTDDASDETHRRRDECATLDGLRQVFSLQGATANAGVPREPARCMTEDNIKLLAREYYNFNEWAVSTLTVLSDRLIALDDARHDAATARIEQLGTYLLGLVGIPVPLEEIEWRALRAFSTPAARGKALFLDIMGFAHTSTMAGDPYASGLEAVARSYNGRLRPRHHALARLAREGVARAIVTTNYDLLIEGAYRLAGFQAHDDPSSDEMPVTNPPSFSRIAGADQFFASGKGQRAALLLKIHGSVDVYRRFRNDRLNELNDLKARQGRQPRDTWASYLPAIVFTYREIQTWRADAWSRDLIRTMLRTNRLALCGYSGADPIMHATFREVYEERAAVLGPGAPDEQSKSDDQNQAKKAPVFFFGLATRREFHSLEILRAASAAVGAPTKKLLNHPNFIEFERSGFPNIDDHFRLIVHHVVRKVQHEAMRTRPRRLATRLLGHLCPDADYKTLLERFEEVLEDEKKAIAAAGDWSNRPDADRRQLFESVVDWTWHFAPGLLRELALAEFVEGRQGPGRVLRTHRLFPWYQAASERLEWTAWAAIVELALRRMVEALPKAKDVSQDQKNQIAAEESAHAAISFTCAGARHQPRALCIRLGGFDRPGERPQLNGAFHHIAYWEFSERDVPWPRRPSGLCPKAQLLWNFAIGREVSSKEAARRLGVMK